MTEFFVTRPTLAGILAEHGIFPIRQQPNPYSPGRQTLVYELSPELGDIVETYYTSINKPVPQVIRGITRREGGCTA